MMASTLALAAAMRSGVELRPYTPVSSSRRWLAAMRRKRAARSGEMSLSFFMGATYRA